MLGRLFFVIHWILFFAFLGSWGLFLVAIIDGGTDKAVRDLDNMFDGGLGLRGILISGTMTWIPPVFLFIDYVVNGDWTLYPWNRKKD
jgi:hypothetical protein